MPRTGQQPPSAGLFPRSWNRNGARMSCHHAQSPDTRVSALMGPTLFLILFLEFRYNVAYLCSIRHHDTTLLLTTSVEKQSRKSNHKRARAGKRNATMQVQMAAAHGTEGEWANALVRRKEIASAIPLPRRASGAVAVKLSGQEPPMRPRRTTMSVGYHSTEGLGHEARRYWLLDGLQQYRRSFVLVCEPGHRAGV